MDRSCERAPFFDTSDPLKHLRILGEYASSASDAVIGYVDGTVVPGVVSTYENASTYVVEEYQSVATLTLLLFVVFTVTSFGRNRIRLSKKGGTSTKWFHNLSPDEELRVTKRKPGGYAVMRCTDCSEVAVFGESLDKAPVSCLKHRPDGMMKVIGCSNDACRKRRMKGSKYCKDCRRS